MLNVLLLWPFFDESNFSRNLGSAPSHQRMLALLALCPFARLGWRRLDTRVRKNIARTQRHPWSPQRVPRPFASTMTPSLALPPWKEVSYAKRSGGSHEIRLIFIVESHRMLVFSSFQISTWARVSVTSGVFMRSRGRSAWRFLNLPVDSILQLLCITSVLSPLEIFVSAGQAWTWLLWLFVQKINVNFMLT